MNLFLITGFKVCVFVTNLSDSLLRSPSNDSFINLFVFYWTNFWYIPLFFCALFISQHTKKNITLNTFFPIIIYFYEFWDVSSSNWSLNFNNYFITNINLLLVNNINKYHPIIFYVSVATFFTLFSQYWNYLTFDNLWQTRRIHYETKFFFLFISSRASIALYLGSWWALQEGTWGGWWNWDASETFGFLLLVFSLVIFHTRSSNTLNTQSLLFSQIFLGLYIICYVLIQLNFDLISHNFGIKFFYFFNNSFFLLENLILSCAYLLYLITVYSAMLKQTKVYRLFCYKKFYSLIAPTFVFLFSYNILIILASFGPLLNYFSWFFLSLNLFNEIGPFMLVNNNSYIYFFLLLFLRLQHPLILCIIWICVLFDTLFAALVTILCFRLLLSKIHNLFLIIVIINLYSAETQLSLNTLQSCYTYITTHNIYNWFYNFNLLLDKEQKILFLIPYPTPHFNFVWQTFLINLSNVPIFSFFVSSQTFYSSLPTLGETFFFIAFTEINPLNLAIFLFVLIFAVVFHFSFSTRKIYLF